MLLFLIQFFIFASSFAHFVIAALPDAATAGNIATLMFSMALTFNGVFQPPAALPGFWIFMYRVSPLTYLVNGMVATGLAGKAIECSPTEVSVFPPPAGQTCGQYLAAYLQTAPGTLRNPMSTTSCEYCSLSNTDQLLASDNIFYTQRWRNFGIVFAYIGFNIAAAVLLYYFFRVRKVNIGGLFSGMSGIFRKKGDSKTGDKEPPVERKAENPSVI